MLRNGFKEFKDFFVGGGGGGQEEVAGVEGVEGPWWVSSSLKLVPLWPPNILNLPMLMVISLLMPYPLHYTHF